MEEEAAAVEQQTPAAGESIAQLIERHAPIVRETALHLRELVLRLAPDAIETVDAPDHLLAYGWSERMRDLVFAIAPHTAHVNLQLADGALLPDPTGIVEGTGKRIRHVKCRSTDDVARPAVRDLIEAQIAARPKPG